MSGESQNPLKIEEIREPSGFAVLIRIVGVLTFLASLWIGHDMSTEYGRYYSSLNKSLYAVYISIGILSGIGWWSLSYIVDASIKYLKND